MGRKHGNCARKSAARSAARSTGRAKSPQAKYWPFSRPSIRPNARTLSASNCSATSALINPARSCVTWKDRARTKQELLRPLLPRQVSVKYIRDLGDIDAFFGDAQIVIDHGH